MLQVWEKELQNSGFIGVIYRDLFEKHLQKAYNCLIHGQLIAWTLSIWSCLDRTSFNLLIDHLNSRKQQRDIVSPTTTGLKLNVEFHKGTMLGLLSFNIFINDLFFVVFLVVILQFCTLYSCGANLETILIRIWNTMLLNPYTHFKKFLCR